MPKHGMLTWNDVLTHIQKFSSDELNQIATIQIGGDEFFGLRSIGVSKNGDRADGILDHGHFYFGVEK